MTILTRKKLQWAFNCSILFFDVFGERQTMCMGLFGLRINIQLIHFFK